MYLRKEAGTNKKGMMIVARRKKMKTTKKLLSNEGKRVEKSKVIVTFTKISNKEHGCFYIVTGFKFLKGMMDLQLALLLFGSNFSNLWPSFTVQFDGR